MIRQVTKTVSKLKKDLWKEFALYIKLKHAVNDEWCLCYTCDTPIRIGSHACHAGHFLGKASSPMHYYNENNVRPQCSTCNTTLGGNPQEFERRLRLEIGDKAVTDMQESARRTVKRPRQWYIDQIRHYRTATRELQARY